MAKETMASGFDMVKSTPALGKEPTAPVMAMKVPHKPQADNPTAMDKTPMTTSMHKQVPPA